MPSAVQPDKPKRVRIKVRATKLGFYDNVRRREGDVFVLESNLNKAGEPVLFSSKWMERVSADTPTSQTTGNQELRKNHEEIRGTKARDVADDATGDVDKI